MTRAQRHVTIKAETSRVWTALTDSAELRQWLCEDADVDIDAGRYDFWGRYTIANPNRDEGRHKIIDHEPGRAIRFDWRLRGSDTTVLVTVEADGDSTRLEIVHDGLPEWQWSDGATPEHFWGAACDNLIGWIERGDPGFRFDFATSARGDYTVDVGIDAPTTAVWSAVREVVSQWEEQDSHTQRPLEILNLVEGESVTHTLPFGSQAVTFTLKERGGRTQLFLMHSGFDDPDETTEAAALGFAATLAWIKARAETGEDRRTRATAASTGGDGGAAQLLADAVWGSTDQEIAAFAESLGGIPRLLDMVFAGMTARIEPAGDCVVGFAVGADFVITVSPDNASYRAKDLAGVDAVIHMTTPDFLRMVVLELPAAEATATRRLTIEGDANAATRLLAMLPASRT